MTSRTGSSRGAPESRVVHDPNPKAGLRLLRALTAGALGVAVDAIFPKRCKGCEAFLSLGVAGGFCAECWSGLRLVHPPYCLLCGWPYIHAWAGGHLCADCLLRPPRFLRARSWVCYPRDAGLSDPVRRAVQRFKYGRRMSYGIVLGELMASGCKARFGRPDVIIPVPLHPQRLRWRGFNQAVVLGRAVSRSWQVPLDPFVLEKSRPTRPQTELARKERQTNVRGAFSINGKKTVQDQHLLLVDDIYTSGATVTECTRVLLRAGARTVQVLTLGRTV